MIIRSWQQVFRVLPTLGLAVGLAIPFLPSPWRGKVTGTVKLRAVWSEYVPVSPDHLAELFRSDHILEQTVQTLDLPARWRMSALDCTDRLRQSMESNPVRESGSVQISVKATSRKEAVTIWNHLVVATAGRIESLADAIRREQLFDPEGEFQPMPPAHARPPTPTSATYRDLLHRKQPLHVPDIRSYRPGVESEVSPPIVERPPTESLPEQPTAIRWPSPIIIIEAPDHPQQHLSFMGTVRSMLFCGSLGLAAGTLLALILAYLLELLFPRKADTFSPVNP